MFGETINIRASSFKNLSRKEQGAFYAERAKAAKARMDKIESENRKKQVRGELARFAPLRVRTRMNNIE